MFQHKFKLFVIGLLLSSTVFAQTWKSEEIFKTGAVIWALEPISDNEMLLTTRTGEFHLLDLKTKKSKKLKASFSPLVEGQGGLLDISLHPDFSKNNKIYFTYSCKKDSGNTTCLATGTFDKKALAITDIKDIFAALPAIDSNLHYGNRIAWDENKNLYMTMGDRYSEKAQAQDLNSHLGKTIRLDENGKAAAGNPFIGQPNTKPEIFSYGHRNPQGLFYDLSTKTLWQTEHGARGGDEVNKINAGKNYGWPVITHGVDYSGAKIGEGKEKAGMEQPIHFYTPSIATSSIVIYSGKKYKDLTGHIFVGALVGQHISHLEYKNNKVAKQNEIETNDRVRDLIETPSGDLFYSTDSGRVVRLTKN